MNRYPAEEEDAIDVQDIDNTVDRQQQIGRIAKQRDAGEDSAVEEALNQLTEVVRTGEGNLLAYAVKAARVRATIGEISDAIEAVSGRHKAVIQAVSGVYSSNFSNQEEMDNVIEMAEEFLEN